jgi:hypothetical protein
MEIRDDRCDMAGKRKPLSDYEHWKATSMVRAKYCLHSMRGYSVHELRSS